MDLSARLFGVNSWSILAPQALEGVACVGVLYLTVRRWFGPVAGLLAGLVLALTPVATLMFRFNNPDALLVLLLTLGAYAMTRAIEKAGTRWLVLAAALVGLGFTTKMLQALLVVPAFAAAYAMAAPTPPWRRVRQLAVAALALLVSCGWWVAIVQLWPAASRPYVGGSQTNSVVELIFGYNGLGRITGNETGSVVPGGAGRAGAWGATGSGPPVLVVVGRPDRLAAAGRPAVPGRAALATSARAAHRPHARRRRPVGRRPAGHRRRVQLCPGHHPRVLRGGSGPRHRRPRRDRRDRPLGAPLQGRLAAVSGGHRRRPPPSGRSCCSTARRPGCRGCASSCWAAAFWPPPLSSSPTGWRDVPPWPSPRSASPSPWRVRPSTRVQTASAAHSGSLPTAGPTVSGGRGGGFGPRRRAGARPPGRPARTGRPLRPARRAGLQRRARVRAPRRAPMAAPGPAPTGGTARRERSAARAAAPAACSTPAGRARRWSPCSSETPATTRGSRRPSAPSRRPAISSPPTTP